MLDFVSALITSPTKAVVSNSLKRSYGLALLGYFTAVLSVEVFTGIGAGAGFGAVIASALFSFLLVLCVSFFTAGLVNVYMETFVSVRTGFSASVFTALGIVRLVFVPLFALGVFLRASEIPFSAMPVLFLAELLCFIFSVRIVSRIYNVSAIASLMSFIAPAFLYILMIILIIGKVIFSVFA